MVTRRGTVLSIPIALILVFSLIIGVLMASTIMDEVIASTNNDQLNQDVLNKASDALSLFDKGIIVVFIGLMMFTVLTSIRIPSNPAFFFPAAVFLGVTVWLSANFSNVIWEFMNVEPILSTVNSDFPTLVFFVEHWPHVTASMGLVILVALYMKGQRQPEAIGV